MNAPTRLWRVALAALGAGPLGWLMASLIQARFAGTLTGTSPSDLIGGLATAVEWMRLPGMVLTVTGLIGTLALLPVERARRATGKGP